MRKIFSAAVFCCLVLSMLFWGVRSNSHAKKTAPRYTVADLTAGSKQKYSFISASGINDKGEVAGQVDGRAFWWRNGELSFIGQLPGSTSCGATDVNDAGQIVGTCSFGEWDKKYFFWQSGQMQNLGSAPFLIHKIIINKSGEVLFNLETKHETSAVLWRNGQQKILGNGWPWALNDKGQVAGIREGNTKLKVGSKRREEPIMSAVVWQNGETVTAGKAGSIAVLLNNRYDLVLWEEDYSVSPALRRSFLVRGGKKTLLGKFKINVKDQQIIAETAINEHCQILGTGLRGNGVFLWQNEVWYDLKNLIPANPGWTLGSVQDINESGQIAGSGTLNGKTRAFLLTPIS